MRSLTLFTLCTMSYSVYYRICSTFWSEQGLKKNVLQTNECTVCSVLCTHMSVLCVLCYIYSYRHAVCSVSTYVHHDMRVVLTYRLALLEHGKKKTRLHEAKRLEVLVTCELNFNVISVLNALLCSEVNAIEKVKTCLLRVHFNLKQIVITMIFYAKK